MQPPESSSDDRLRAAEKFAVSLVPYIGGGLAVLFERVFEAPMERRRQEWLREVGAVIQELCEKVHDLTPEELSKNEAFISICLQASAAALRTHREEKRKALRAAVKNTVLLSIGDVKGSMFVRLLDEFSEVHMRVLDMYANSEAYVKRLQEQRKGLTHYPAMSGVWDECFSDLNSGDPLVKLAERDIVERGLAHVESLRTSPRTKGVLTPLGEEFVQFIDDAG